MRHRDNPPVFAPFLVILAGITAAIHVAKLPPAIGALQQSLGIGLVEAGFLVSIVQVAGMATAVGMGAWADTLGRKRSLLTGLTVLAIASMAGAMATGSPMLLVLRAAEGFGFLFVAISAPALLRDLVPRERVDQVMGLWSTYMPVGTAIALLFGPSWIEAMGWRTWWWAAGVLSGLMAIVAYLLVPLAYKDALRRLAAATAQPEDRDTFATLLQRTLAAPGPWLLALCFSMYAFQWLAIIGFLPTIYEQAGIGAASRGALTALASAINITGNIGAGRLLQAGVRPVTLLRVGLVAMAASAFVAFAGAGGGGASPTVRYLAILAFSTLGGMVPATLFALSMRLAPDERTVSTTVGWMMQWSAIGQFVGPPAAAFVASRVGGWHWTWAVTGAAAAVGLLLTQRIGNLLRHGRASRPSMAGCPNVPGSERPPS
jgi:CP family cyanate transporter-like MFS transporter